MNSATDIDPDDLEGLIPRITTQAELDEYEQQNILAARLWIHTAKRLCDDYPSPKSLCRLHRRMFDRTWNWAGAYRTSLKNMGIVPEGIPEAVALLCGDVQAWKTYESYTAMEQAARFHHRLVQIHPFRNGNGRHARLAADVLMMCRGDRPLQWGPRDPHASGDHRSWYIEALRAADAHDYGPLLAYLERYREAPTEE